MILGDLKSGGETRVDTGGVEDRGTTRFLLPDILILVSSRKYGAKGCQSTNNMTEWIPLELCQPGLDEAETAEARADAINFYFSARHQMIWFLLIN